MVFERGRRPLARVSDVLARHRITLALLSVLSIWYIIQIIVVTSFDLNEKAYEWWFTVTPEPSPGWVLAPISHALPPNYLHLLSNVGTVAVFGAATEVHVSKTEYLGFVVVAGLLAPYLQVAYGVTIGEPFAVLGASGAGFGLVTFYATHQSRHHPPTLAAEDHGWLCQQLRYPYVVFVYVGSIIVVGLLVTQFIGLLPSGRSAVVVHLSGAGLGILFEYWWAEANGLCDCTSAGLI